MKKILLIVSLFISTFISAQNDHLVIEGTAPNLYITHTVSPKEGLFSIGRMYNQAPKVIATFNKIAMDHGLVIGQRIKIPVNTMNLDVTGAAPAGESLVPLYHRVAAGETLFRISNNHSAKVDAVKQWNGITSDVIDPGKTLVVGYLRIKNDQLASFGSATTSPAYTSTDVQAKAATSTTIKTEQTQKETTEADTATQPATTSAEPVVAPQTITEIKPTTAATPTRTDTVAQAKQVVTDTQHTSLSAKGKDDSMNAGAAIEKTVQNDTPAKTVTNNSSVKQEQRVGDAVAGMFNEEGEFASLFVDRKEETEKKSGIAATFKSTSGWQDKKYYILINNIESGTIVKVSAGDKTVYAKVLGSMPEMKENSGVLLRISNAAASYLGIIDPKFPVEISY